MNYGFIKVAAAVPFVRVADCFYNVDRIEQFIFKANKEGVEIVVFPELSVTGYTCGDLFHQCFLQEEAVNALLQLVEHTASTKVLSVVGMPILSDSMLVNAAVVFQSGKILGVVPKTFLPNYKEFQEARWFTPAIQLHNDYVILGGKRIPMGRNLLFENGDVKIGVEICEDLWVPVTPGSRLALKGANVIVNLSASNEVVGKHAELRQLISRQSLQNLTGYVYASAGFGESSGDVVFLGKAWITDIGDILAEMGRFGFKEQMIVSEIDVERIICERQLNSSFRQAVDLYAGDPAFTVPFERDETRSFKLTRYIDAHPFVPSEGQVFEDCSDALNIQVGGLAQRMRHINARKAVIGVSGGLDSTLALLVLVKTFDVLNLDRKGIIAVTMPGFGTGGRTYENALKMMDGLGVTLMEIPIKESVLLHFQDIGHDKEMHDVTYENSQARERTQILMDLANKVGGLVIGTGDLSEMALGWATFNGDHMSMYNVNAGVPKTLARAIVDYLARNDIDFAAISEILLDVVATPISPELLPTEEGKGHATESIVGPYELHDFFIYYFLKCHYSPAKIYYLAQYAFGTKYSNEELKKWLYTFFKRFFANQFKRNAFPDGPKVCSVGLSPRGDFRMPSDCSSSLWLSEIERLP